MSLFLRKFQKVGTFLKENYIYIWFVLILVIGLSRREQFYIKFPHNIPELLLKDIVIIIVVGVLIAKISGYNPGKSLKNIINFVIIFPIAEEILFRGIIFSLSELGTTKIYIITSISLAVLISAVCFGITHLQYHNFKITALSRKQILIAFIGGIFMGKIVEQTGSIILPLVIHITFNFSATVFSRLNDRYN